MNERGRPGVPPLAGLTPHFSITVLECRQEDADSAFLTLRHYLRETLADPGRSFAVRLRGERVLTGPDEEVEGVGTLSALGVQGLYVLVRERWQRPRWSTGDSDLRDLDHELTVVLRRDRLVALHSGVSGSLLRRWTRSAASPYRFLPEDVLAETFPERSGLVVASPPWSRLTSPSRPDFRGYVTETVAALDQLAKAMQVRRPPEPPWPDLA